MCRRVNNAASVAACLLQEELPASTLPTTTAHSSAAHDRGDFSIDCLAASVRALHIPYTAVTRCLLPCVRHWKAVWRTAEAERSWATTLHHGLLERRHGLPHELLLQHNNELVLARVGRLSEREPVRWFGSIGSQWLAFVAPLVNYSSVLDRAWQAGMRVSLLEYHDLYQPLPRSERLLAHPALAQFFAHNPSPAFAAHPKVSGYPRHVFNAERLEPFLRNATPLERRPHLMLCIAHSRKWNRGEKEEILRRNGLPCQQKRLSLDEYYFALTRQYQVVFAPGGRGAAEHKFWEAAAAGTIILTDYTASQFELLRGLPTIMMGQGAYKHITPSYLTELVETIRRDAHRYDPMKAFLPQWLYRLQTATPTSQNLLGAELAPPIVLMKNRGSNFSLAKREQAEQDALEALKAQGRDGGYYGGLSPV